LVAPFGAGCYELRRGSQLVLFGISGHVALRMTSLLPAPMGRGIRNNAAKRRYILKHIGKIEYRTATCEDRQETVREERKLKQKSSAYVFGT
jgi:hypothetical protein